MSHATCHSSLVFKAFCKSLLPCIKLRSEIQSRADAAGVSADKRFLPFLCSGIDDDSSSLMQQKLERQVRKQTAIYVHTLFDKSHLCCLFLAVALLLLAFHVPALEFLIDHLVHIY